MLVRGLSENTLAPMAYVEMGTFADFSYKQNNVVDASVCYCVTRIGWLYESKETSSLNGKESVCMTKK